MSSTSDVTTTPETNSAERLTGRVKWFNNKAGYGFITVTDGSKTGTDIFVHHSAICVSNQQYKYLLQGEYVEFSLVNVENSTHECQASVVGGIKGGKLMCETRREFKIARNSYRTTPGSPEDNEYAEPVKMPRQTKVREQESMPPQDGDTKPWTMVSKQTVKPVTPAPSTGGRGRGRPPRAKA
jgi:CspA family cold shock protein